MSNKVYEIVTERIIKELEKGIIPWAKPWVGGQRRAVNWVTQKPYKGINQFLLDPGEYATFNQIRQAGGKVKKGEKATPVIFWKWMENAMPEKDKEEVEETSHQARRGRPILRYYNVFEINTQVEGLKSKVAPTEAFEHSPIEEAERIVANFRDCPRISHAPGRAYYVPALDYISLPAMTDFPEIAEYYSTLFHEISHSTGHSKRLCRDGVATNSGGFGSEPYSKEELVAELGAAMLCALAGIEFNVANTAAYIGNWLQRLKDDRRLIVFAAAQAAKAADYVTGADIKEEEEEAAA